MMSLFKILSRYTSSKPITKITSLSDTAFYFDNEPCFAVETTLFYSVDFSQHDKLALSLRKILSNDAKIIYGTFGPEGKAIIAVFVELLDSQVYRLLACHKVKRIIIHHGTGKCVVLHNTETVSNKSLCFDTHSVMQFINK